MTPEDDRLHTGPEAGFHDAVTFAFGDPGAKLYGIARLSHGAGATTALAVLYAGDKPVASGAGRGGAPEDAREWDGVTAAGVRVSVVAPLEAWTVAWDGDGGGFDLRFEACSAPAALDAEGPVVRVGAMEGYEQLCRVTGSVSHGGRTYQVRCLGQRGQLWGSPDWSRLELTRMVSAWLGDDRALTLMSVRPAKAKSHLDEAVSGFLFEAGEAVEIADPRLSTTYDRERRQRRAGLELWMTDDGDYARRVAGEALCTTALDIGDKRFQSAFFLWRMEGREGIGRYDVVRRAPNGGGGGSRKRSR